MSDFLDVMRRELARLEDKAEAVRDLIALYEQTASEIAVPLAKPLLGRSIDPVTRERVLVSEGAGVRIECREPAPTGERVDFVETRLAGVVDPISS